jgi:hypothetical protein
LATPYYNLSKICLHERVLEHNILPSCELLCHIIRYIQRAKKDWFLMAITAAGHEQVVLFGELDVLRSGLGIVSLMPTLDTINVF